MTCIVQFTWHIVSACSPCCGGRACHVIDQERSVACHLTGVVFAWDVLREEVVERSYVVLQHCMFAGELAENAACPHYTSWEENSTHLMAPS